MKEHTMETPRTTARIQLPVPTRPHQPRVARFTRRAVTVATAGALALGSVGAAAGPAMAQTAPSTETTAATAAAATTTTIQTPAAAEQYRPTPLVFGNYPAGAVVDSSYSLTGDLAKRPGNVVRFFGFRPTTLQTVRAAALELELTHANYVNDEFALEYSVDGWRTAHPLTTFGESNPLPATMTTLRFSGLESSVNRAALASHFEVRLRAVGQVRGAERFTLKIGQVRLVLQGS
ncbi:MAG TPA: hypothetical protein VFN74_04210 [Chloroflexota bacterium]|nr:hypothetical protein [Chloroflexota bacterium]